MSKKNTSKNIKIPDNTKKKLSDKSYITIQYTPTGLGIGLVTGIIAGQEVNFLLLGLLIGGGIDYLTSMYKKKQLIDNKR